MPKQRISLAMPKTDPRSSQEKGGSIIPMAISLLNKRKVSAMMLGTGHAVYDVESPPAKESEQSRFYWQRSVREFAMRVRLRPALPHLRLHSRSGHHHALGNGCLYLVEEAHCPRQASQPLGRPDCMTHHLPSTLSPGIRTRRRGGASTWLRTPGGRVHGNG